MVVSPLPELEMVDQDNANPKQRSLKGSIVTSIHSFLGQQNQNDKGIVLLRVLQEQFPRRGIEAARTRHSH